MKNEKWKIKNKKWKIKNKKYTNYWFYNMILTIKINKKIQ